jgi:hypothetical protein
MYRCFLVEKGKGMKKKKKREKWVRNNAFRNTSNAKNVPIVMEEMNFKHWLHTKQFYIPEGEVTENLFNAKMAADLVLNDSMKDVSPSLKILWKIINVLSTTYWY